ncbi:hypothetical protein B0H14DRAFT_3157835 [Mycena olivaceomarginata]|nr:hypothetical protein B0H14DRAFT_3157835 [Mycena olivaceomarginata]
MTHIRPAEVGPLGDLHSYKINTLRGLLRNFGGPPLGGLALQIRYSMSRVHVIGRFMLKFRRHESEADLNSQIFLVNLELYTANPGFFGIRQGKAVSANKVHPYALNNTPLNARLTAEMIIKKPVEIQRSLPIGIRRFAKSLVTTSGPLESDGHHPSNSEDFRDSRVLGYLMSLIDLPPTAHRTESLHLFAASQMANPGIGYNVLSDSVGYDRETLVHNVLMGGQGSTLYPPAEPSLASARVLQLDGYANTGSSSRVGGRGQRRQSGRGRGGEGRGTSAGRSRAGGRVREGEHRGSGRGGGEPTQTVSQAPHGRGRGTPSGGPSAIGQRGKGGIPAGRGNGGNAAVATGSGTTPTSNSVPNGEGDGGGGGRPRGRGRKSRKRSKGRGQNSSSPVQHQYSVERWAPGEYAEFMTEFGWDVENMTIFDSD